LEFARLHRADCERCGRFQDCWGDDIRKRLEELREFERSPRQLSTAKKPNHSADDAA
jgi:hypothetical protein